MQVTGEAKTFGAVTGIAAAVVPDWLLSSLEKLLLAAAVALVSGFCYAAGQWFWGRLKK